jgi:hypothetical protein
MTHINDEIQHIHPCTTRPLDISINTFDELFQNDVCILINVCNWHVCNPTCYKVDVDTFKKLCKYNFLQPLINVTHFVSKTKLLHIKITDKWLNNANPWILLASRCKQDLNFITTLGKDSKYLICYITNYITKTSIYIMHMYSLLQIVVQKTPTIIENTNAYESIDKSQCLIIRCLNRTGGQQEILVTRAINYLLNMLDHIIDYDFTYIPWYIWLTWV